MAVGINGILDAVIGPLNVAADYVEKISNGAIPQKITDQYNGDFNTIKNKLNKCIDTINALVADAQMLSVAVVEGRLATRADATKHLGDYQKIIESVFFTTRMGRGESGLSLSHSTISTMGAGSRSPY